MTLGGLSDKGVIPVDTPSDKAGALPCPNLMRASCPTMSLLLRSDAPRIAESRENITKADAVVSI